MNTNTRKAAIDRHIRLITAAAVLCVCSGGAMTHRQALIKDLPPWVHLNKTDVQYCIHTERTDETARFLLKNGSLSVTSDNGLYISDPEWIVADLLIFDIDRDKNDEVILHVWKKGSYGEFHPFWEDEEQDPTFSEHLFIYDWDTEYERRLRPVWMSSAMPVKGKYICADEDGILHITAPDQSETMWRWGSWGLMLTE